MSTHRRRTFQKGSIGRFVQKHGLSIHVREVPAHVIERRQEHPGQRHFVVTLTKRDGAVFAIPWSQGSAVRGTPDLEDVLETIGADALMYYEYGTPEEYGRAFGDDEENWEKNFELLETFTMGMARFFGERAFDELMSMSQEGFELGGEARCPKILMCA